MVGFASLLDDPIGDGGWWIMATNLIDKYGLVPKSVYPESYTSENTSKMNKSLEYLLMAASKEVRDIAGTNSDEENYHRDAQAYKAERLKDVYRILSIHLGTPPKRFQWEWRDREGQIHIVDPNPITPLEFATKTLEGLPFQSYVTLMHDPRNKYYQTYTVQYSQSVICGKHELVHLNVPIDEMKWVAKRMIQDLGLPVWFACNVGEEFAETPGLWDKNLYGLQELYGVQKLGYDMTKEDRIKFGYPMGTHAMLFTGCDVIDDDGESGKHSPPRRWKVENSWGTSGGHDGYYTMNDNWFDEYVFVVVASPDCLTDEMKVGLKTDPIVLPPWDPTNAARRRSSSRRRF